MDGFLSVAEILGAGVSRAAKAGETSSQAQDLSTPTLTDNEASEQFGSSYYAKDPYLPSNIIEERGYKAEKPAPEPEICEFCGKKLYYNGLINHFRRDRYGKEPTPTVFRWGDTPQRCDCPEAAAKWKAHDDEIERQRIERERQEEAERHRRRVEEALGCSGIKRRFMSRTFDSFVTDTPERAAAHRAAKDYADAFPSHLEAGRGLYIEGTLGTGKTHLAAAIALHLIEAEYNVILKTADDLFRDIKRTFDEDGGAGDKILDRYKTCDLLVIDDLGKEQATEWTTSILYAIINDRYESMKPVIITTNFNENGLIAAEAPKGIGEHRIRAILSRLHETTTPLTMAWPDWRSKA